MLCFVRSETLQDKWTKRDASTSGTSLRNDDLDLAVSVATLINCTGTVLVSCRYAVFFFSPSCFYLLPRTGANIWRERYG
jgi:hypothetical protein